MDEITKRNSRVQARYDELMREGKHGHYESMFCVVGEEVERALSPPKPKWPGRVTSSTTECAHAVCPHETACAKGCIKHQPITLDDAPTAH